MEPTNFTAGSPGDPPPRQVVLVARPWGRAVAADFATQEMSLPVPLPGEVLLRTRYLSIDPFIRGRLGDRNGYARPIGLGEAIPCDGLAEVLDGSGSGFARGDLVVGRLGMATHAVCAPETLRKVAPLPVPPTTALGVLGWSGFSAWYGLREIGRPRPGETLVVAAATGSVGSMVGQLARRAGARVVGVAGGPEKCAFALEVLGFDAVIDHRSPDMAAELRDACPDGVDVYFENVGGAVTDAVIPLLNLFARMPVCGLITQYAGPGGMGVPLQSDLLRTILIRHLVVRGFYIPYFADLMPQFLEEVEPLVAAGEIAYREDVVDGLENAPLALLGMLDGRNFGKPLVRLA